LTAVFSTNQTGFETTQALRLFWNEAMAASETSELIVRDYLIKEGLTKTLEALNEECEEVLPICFCFSASQAVQFFVVFSAYFPTFFVLFHLLHLHFTPTETKTKTHCRSMV
jgi:hypothetical protein